MWLVLAAALGLLAFGSKGGGAGSGSGGGPGTTLSRLWSKSYLAPSNQSHVFDVVPNPPFDGAPKALTAVMNGIGLHGSPVFATPDGKRVAFAPLSDRELFEKAGFVMFSDGHMQVLR